MTGEISKTYVPGYSLCVMIHKLNYTKSVWVQDVPMRQTTIRHDAKAVDFPGTLQRVLDYLNVPNALHEFLDGDVSFSLHNSMLPL